MNKKNLSYLLGFFVLLAIIAWGAAFAVSKQDSLYNYNVNGLFVKSNDFDPKTYFAELGNSGDFIISPEMHETVSSVDPYVFGASNTFSVVLNGNKKNATLLVRVLDQNNSLAYCLTNLGDVKKSEQISGEKCLEELASQDKVRILIDNPNDAVQSTFVMLEKNKITLKPKNYSQVDKAAYVVSLIMYENTDAIISKSNDVVSGLNSGSLS